MRVWITKYALTSGIFSVADAEIRKTIDGSEYIHIKESGLHMESYVFGNNYRLSKEDALIDAEKRRQKRIASLKRSLQKMENMNFDIKDY